MKLHHSSASPNSRRVRMFIAEKGLDVELVNVDFANLFADVDALLADRPFVAGAAFSVADITLLATVDFAPKALDIRIADEHANLRRWVANVAERPSARA